MIINDNGIDREMTEAEETAHLAILAKYAKEDEAQAETQADKTTARQAVLDRLGITADEAALLLG